MSDTTELSRAMRIAVEQYPIIGVPLCDEIAHLKNEVQRLREIEQLQVASVPCLHCAGDGQYLYHGLPAGNNFHRHCLECNGTGLVLVPKGAELVRLRNG